MNQPIPSSWFFNRSLVLTAITKIKIPLRNKCNHFLIEVLMAIILFITFLNKGKTCLLCEELTAITGKASEYFHILHAGLSDFLMIVFSLRGLLYKLRLAGTEIKLALAFHISRTDKWKTKTG